MFWQLNKTITPIRMRVLGINLLGIIVLTVFANGCAVQRANPRYDQGLVHTNDSSAVVQSTRQSQVTRSTTQTADDQTDNPRKHSLPKNPTTLTDRTINETLTDSNQPTQFPVQAAAYQQPARVYSTPTGTMQHALPADYLPSPIITAGQNPRSPTSTQQPIPATSPHPMNINSQTPNRHYAEFSTPIPVSSVPLPMNVAPNQTHGSVGSYQQQHDRQEAVITNFADGSGMQTSVQEFQQMLPQTGHLENGAALQGSVLNPTPATATERALALKDQNDQLRQTIARTNKELKNQTTQLNAAKKLLTKKEKQIVDSKTEIANLTRKLSISESKLRTAKFENEQIRQESQAKLKSIESTLDGVLMSTIQSRGKNGFEYLKK